MVKSASEEDEDIEKLSKLFYTFLNHEEFEEFEMTPMPKRKLHIRDFHAVSEGGVTHTASISNSNQKKIQTFLEWISQLENSDQDIYISQIGNDFIWINL